MLSGSGYLDGLSCVGIGKLLLQDQQRHESDEQCEGRGAEPWKREQNCAAKGI